MTIIIIRKKVSRTWLDSTQHSYWTCQRNLPAASCPLASSAYATLKKIILPTAEKLQAGRARSLNMKTLKKRARTSMGPLKKGKSWLHPCQNPARNDKSKTCEAGGRGGGFGEAGGVGMKREQFARTHEHTEIKDMIPCLPSQQIQQTFHW